MAVYSILSTNSVTTSTSYLDPTYLYPSTADTTYRLKFNLDSGTNFISGFDYGTSDYAPMSIYLRGTAIPTGEDVSYHLYNSSYWGPSTLGVFNASYTNYSNYSTIIEPTKKDLFRSKIHFNLTPKSHSRFSDLMNIKKNEQIALETLREVLTEVEFRKYLKYGFVLVKGKKGDTFQIFRNKSHVKVWRDGQLIEEICVNLKDRSIPATDKILAFKVAIECDEEDFKKMGNVYKMQVAA